MAEASYKRGEYPKAQGLYQDVWNFYPGSKQAARARLGFALASWRAGESERAKWMLASISGADARTREMADYLSALISQSTGDFAEAALQWERYFYQHPKGRFANQAGYNRSLCLVQQGDFSAAASELQRLLTRRLKKDFRTQARLLLASALERSGKAAEALSSYRLLERSTISPADQRTVALSIARMKASGLEPDQARGLYRELAAKHPRTEASSSAYYLMAELWEQENVLDSAQAYYTMSRQESPGSPVAEEALRAASDIAMLQALGVQTADGKSREQNAAIQYLMAEHYLFQLNQPDQALERYGSVSSAYADLPIAAKSLYASGWVYLRSKADTAAADSVFSLLVERYPRTRYANGAREHLGLPLDTAVADTEPEIVLAVPISIKIDTTTAPIKPEGQQPEPDKKIPAPPGMQGEPPKPGSEQDGMIKGDK
jgi:TolA-binding protein